MKKYRLFLIILPVIFCGIILSAGCDNDAPQPGVVARVNGVPIFFKDVEYGYDHYFFELSDSLPPSAQAMKNTYGRALLDLILIELIRSELDAGNMDVSQDEVLRIENEIRQDYPNGEFEKMLIEESIDLQYWRNQIRHKLLWEKFINKVLMPDINVDLNEIQDYYYLNIQDFYIPERLVYVYLGSEDRQLIEKALHKLENYENVQHLREESGNNILIASYEMREDQLPPDLSGDLLSLDENQTTGIKQRGQEGYYAIYLVEKKEKQLLKPHQVYSVIEKKITDDKLNKAFNNWLSVIFENSHIEINKVLLDNLTGSSH
jgi:hypothetical protein